MSPKLSHQIFFYCFVSVIFIVVTVLLIAITNGYLFNKKTMRFQQTGIISLTVEQAPVTVRINGKPKLYKKPGISFSYLLPGYYDIEVSKPDYMTWAKTMQVTSGAVIPNPSVVLFLANSTAHNATERQVAQLQSQVPTRDADFDIRGNEIWIKQIARTYPITFAQNNYTLVARFISPVVSAQWLPGKSQLLFQLNDEVRVIDRDGVNDYVLAKLSSTTPTLFTTVNGGKILIYQDNGVVYQKQIQ